MLCHMTLYRCAVKLSVGASGTSHPSFFNHIYASDVFCTLETSPRQSHI